MNLSDGFVAYYIANIFFNIVFGYFYAIFFPVPSGCFCDSLYARFELYRRAGFFFWQIINVQLAVIYAGRCFFYVWNMLTVHGPA